MLKFKFWKSKKETSAEELQAKQEKDYARLGKILTRAIKRDNIKVSDNWARFIGVSFVRGLFIGFGSVIGATVLVTIVIWAFNAFDWLPVVGEWLEALKESLKNGPVVD